MRGKKLILLMFIAILLLSSFACGGDGEEKARATPTPTPAETPTLTPTTSPTPTPTPTPSPTLEYDTYADLEHGFSISHPWGWDIRPEEVWVWEPALISFCASSLCEMTTTFFVVRKKVLPWKNISLPEYYEAAKQALEDSERYTFISKEGLTLGRRVGIKHVYTYLREARTYKVMELYMVKDLTGWTISCVTVPACWSQYEPIFDAIVGSFRLVE